MRYYVDNQNTTLVKYIYIHVLCNYIFIYIYIYK